MRTRFNVAKRNSLSVGRQTGQELCKRKKAHGNASRLEWVSRSPGGSIKTHATGLAGASESAHTLILRLYAKSTALDNVLHRFP